MPSVYDCVLRILTTQELILTFSVNSTIAIWPTFNGANSVVVYIQESSFTGYNYNTTDKLAPIRNPSLLQYFLDSASESIIGNPVYGSNIFYLPSNLKNPAWVMGPDN